MSDTASLETPFLDVRQCAERTGLSHKTLEKMRLRGDGPPFLKPSARRVIYDRNEVDAWMRRRVFRSTSEYTAKAA